MRLAALAALVCLPCRATPAQSAESIRRETGIDTGLAVVIGGDLDLACGLADEGRLLVHLLSPDAKRVPELRRSVQRRGLGGRIVTGALPDGRLPHPDRFVNLLVADLDALARRVAMPGRYLDMARLFRG